MKFKQYLTEAASLTTTLQESLHCVGLGITQITKTLLSKKDLFDGNLFGKSYDTHCKVDIGVDDLAVFAEKNPSWVDAIINNVNVLKKSKWLKSNRYTFCRGKGIMFDVYGTSKILLKKSDVTLNADKWNPGDIWATTLSSIPSFDNILDYNNWISIQLNKGTLIGVSLKKSGGSPKVVYIDQGMDKETIEYKSTKKPKSPFNTGIHILSKNPKIFLDIRSFNTAKMASVTSELQIKGSKARHGKSALPRFIKQYNIPWMPLADFKNRGDDTQYMKNMIIDLWKDNGYTFNTNQIEKNWDIRFKEKQFNRSPAGYYRSIINSLQFGAFMNKNKGLADKILTDIYLTGSSQSDFSSDFLKVY